MSCLAWLDLNETSVIPPLGARQAPDLGPVGLMVSTLADFRQIESAMSPDRTDPFFVSRLIRDSQGICAAGPFVGAPYGAMLMESLVVKGVRQIIVLGWCGALSAKLQTGDLVLPDLGLVDEGTSRHYRFLDLDHPSSPAHDGLTQNLADYLSDQEIPFTGGPVWTTDAIYRETPKTIAWFKKQGAVAVEMECSALFSIAAFRDIQVTALLVVSDSLAASTWVPGFKRQRFKAGRDTACQAVLGFARTLAAVMDMAATS